DAFRSVRYRSSDCGRGRAERPRRATKPRQARSHAIRRAGDLLPRRAAAGGHSFPRTTCALRESSEISGADRVLDDFIRGRTAAGDAINGSDRSAASDCRFRHADRILVQPRWVNLVSGGCVDLRGSGGGAPDDAWQPTWNDGGAYDN